MLSDKSLTLVDSKLVCMKCRENVFTDIMAPTVMTGSWGKKMALGHADTGQWPMRTLLWQQPSDWTIRAIHEQTIYTTTIKISSDSPKYFPFLRLFSLASPILISCVGTMNTDPGVVASDGKLQAVLALERRIGVSGYGHNNGGGYLAWLLTTYLWPNMDTEGSYHLTLDTTSSPRCQNVMRIWGIWGRDSLCFQLFGKYSPTRPWNSQLGILNWTHFIPRHGAQGWFTDFSTKGWRIVGIFLKNANGQLMLNKGTAGLFFEDDD